MLIATTLVVAIVVFGVAQILLPPLAAHVVRQRLDKHGRVLSVSVSAFPAIELLFGHAGTVNVAMATYDGSETQVMQNLNQAVDISDLNVSVRHADTGLVDVTSVHMTKRGPHMTAGGDISDAALAAAVPILSSVTPVASSDGQLTVQGTAEVPFVGRVTADATIAASRGDVAVSGSGLLGSFIHLTVWSDPRVRVQSISGASHTGGLAFTVSADIR